MENTNIEVLIRERTVMILAGIVILGVILLFIYHEQTRKEQLSLVRTEEGRLALEEK